MLAGILISQTAVRYTDHMTSVMNGVWRERLGKVIGKIYRPIALSPMKSWKSWAWIVMARMATITDIEKAPGESSLYWSEAIVYHLSRKILRRGTERSHTCNQSRSYRKTAVADRVHQVLRKPMLIAMHFIVDGNERRERCTGHEHTGAVRVRDQ